MTEPGQPPPDDPRSLEQAPADAPLDPRMLAEMASRMYAEVPTVFPETAGPTPEATPGSVAAASTADQALPATGGAGPEAAFTAAAESAGAGLDPRAGTPQPAAAPPSTAGDASYYFLSPPQALAGAEATPPSEQGADPQAAHPEALSPGAALDPDLATKLAEATLTGALGLMPGAEQAATQAQGAAPAEAATSGGPAQAPHFYFLPELEADGAPPKALDTFHVETIRKDFPILHQQIHGKPLIWMDNAATTQKPQAVIDALARFYQRDYSNIHRGAHTLAGRATDAYENARKKVAGFLGAGSMEEIVFVRGATEAINLVAFTWGKKFLTPGDEIVLTELEHHANIVPWQFIAKETGAVIRVAPISDSGEVMLEDYERLLGPRTKIAAFAHVSNALGTVLPVREMTEMAHRYDARVLIDGAQSVPHIRSNVQEVDADFYVFSGHKMFAPAGVGALYAKKELLELMPPWQGGGSMIRNVTFEETKFEDPPAKFEAGTPTIADAVGLGAAIDYLERIGMENIARYEHVLVEYAMERMAEIPGLRPIGTAPGKVSVLSFLLEGATPEEVGRYLDTEGIAVRAGHHCAQPTMQHYGVPSTVRPSLAFYNTHGEVDALVEAIKRFPRH